jgi:hypothetical protein
MSIMPQAPPHGTRLLIIGPPAQVLVKEQDCDGPLAVAHSSAGLDTALLEPQLPLRGSTGGWLISLCTECEVRPHLEAMGGWTALVSTHEPSCPWLARMLRKAGVDR